MDIQKFLSSAFNPKNNDFNPTKKFQSLGIGQRIATVILGILGSFPLIFTGPAVALCAIEYFYQSNQRKIAIDITKPEVKETADEVENVSQKVLTPPEKPLKPNQTIPKISYKVSVGEYTVDFRHEKDISTDVSFDALLGKQYDEKTTPENKIPKDLLNFIKQEKLTPGKAPDNGDCLFSSLSQQLTKLLKRDVSIKDLRTVLSDAALNGDLYIQKSLVRSSFRELVEQGFCSENLKNSLEAPSAIKALSDVLAKQIKLTASEYRTEHEKIISSRTDLRNRYQEALKDINQVRAQGRSLLEKNQDVHATVQKLLKAQEKADMIKADLLKGIHQPIWGGDAELQVLSHHFNVQIDLCTDMTPMFLSFGDSSANGVCKIAQFKAHFIPLWNQ